MIARDLIVLLQEMRVRESWPLSHLRKMMVNLYRKINGENPDDPYTLVFEMYGDDEDHLHAAINVPRDRLLPGMKIIDDYTVHVHEFEDRYLRKTGWSVQNAGISSMHYPEGVDIKLIGITPYNSSKPRFFYHAAPTMYEKSILRKGLVPRKRYYQSIYWYSEPRVYLWDKLDRNAIHSMMEAIAGGEHGSVHENELQYSVFTIDTHKFDRFNIFDDTTHHSGAVYTLTHIPSKALKVKYRDYARY